MTTKQICIDAIRKANWDAFIPLLNDNTDWLLMRLEGKDGNTLLPIHFASKHGQLKLVQLFLEKKPELLNATDDLGNTPLHFAAANNHSAVVAYLVTQKAELTAAINDPKGWYYSYDPDRNRHGYLPIHWATERGHEAVVDILIRAGASTEVLLNSKHLIHIAAENGRFSLVKRFLDNKPTLLNQADKFEQTPLLWAASRGHAEVVLYLISFDTVELNNATNVPNCDDHGKTALLWSIERGHDAVVDVLIQAGANTEVLFNGKSLIQIATNRGHPNVVKVLIEKKPSLLNQTLEYGQTPLLWAAREGYDSLIHYLISRGDVDLNQTTSCPPYNDHDKTALYWATKYGHDRVVNALIQAGANFDLLFHGKHLIHIATENGRFRIINQLLEKKPALLNQVDKDGKTPLHWATELGHDWVVDTLVKAGADLDILLNGKHLVHIAAENGHLWILKILLNTNPSLLNLCDKCGKTPLIGAASRDHTDMVEYLISLAGIDLNKATTSSVDGNPYKTALHWAAERGQRDIVDALIKAGANMETPWNGKHLIHIAAENGHRNVVNYLCTHNPTLLNLTDVYGQTPLLWAAKQRHHDLVWYLTSCSDVDLNKATNRADHNDHGKTALHWATELGHDEAVYALIKAGAHTDEPLNGKHLIHIASENGRLLIVKRLLKINVTLLNQTDVYGQTPLLWAASKGHYELVCYFLSHADVNFNIVTNRPAHPDHGKTPLIQAIENEHYEIANLIILKITAQQSKDAILPYVQAGTQALELMILDPAITLLFLQDDRIMQLIKETSGCRVTKHSIDWYKRQARRPSWFARINTETGSTAVFNPVSVLGEGNYGRVRLFKNAQHQELSVKSLKNNVINISENQKNRQKRKLKKQAEFNQLAYPDDNGISEIFEFNVQSKDQKIYTNRYLMPYIKGETVRKRLPKLTCPYQLGEITLQLARELQRIHDLNIIHGDFSFSNVMIHEENKQLTIRLIDFENACYLTDPRPITYEPSANRKWYAPEIVGAECVIKPNPNQDIYSLGFSLNEVFTKHPSYQELICLFPSIQLFISQATDSNPQARPGLVSFCTQLSNELHPPAKTDTKISSSALIENHLWAANLHKETSFINVPLNNNEEPPIVQTECCVLS